MKIQRKKTDPFEQIRSRFFPNDGISSLRHFGMVDEFDPFFFQALLEGNKAQDIGAEEAENHQVASNKVGKVSHPAPLQIRGLRFVP